MSTQKQIRANRSNARKSTGPKTPEGKAKVSKNALKHGLTSECVLIPGEDPQELEAFREALLADLAPEGALEELSAEWFIAYAWRLRRVGRMEAEVVASGLERWRALGAVGTDEEKVSGAEVADLTPTRLAARILQETDTYAKLGRYETQIERGLYRVYHHLERLQAARRGREVVSPVVVEVDVNGVPDGGQS